eukprot:scaffold2751_cov131-Cylindrotheca_fusiformis.AAC.9
MRKEDSKKKSDEFLKSSALRVLELERSLIQCLGADDANDELNELKARIENYDEKKDAADDGRGTIMQRMNISKSSPQHGLPKKNLAPERALNFALKSLGSSIEYFEQERDLFITKHEDRKKEMEKNEETWKAKIQELEDRLTAANGDRQELEDRCQRQAEQIDSLQTLSDRQEELEDERDKLLEERDRLAGQCEHYESEMMKLESDRDNLQIKYSTLEYEMDETQQLQYPVSDDESLDIDVGMLQNRIEELEAENDFLTIQCKEQAASISLLEKEEKLEKFDKGLQEKADDFKAEEYQRRFADLQAVHTKLKAKCKFQERKIEELESMCQAKDVSVRMMREERERDMAKTTAFENAMREMGEERSRLLSKIQDAEDLNQMLRFKCKAQQDAIISVKQDSGILKQIRLDIGNGSLEEIEDDRERLTLRCASLEVHIAMLENEIAVLESQSLAKDRIIKDMKNSSCPLSTDNKAVNIQVRRPDP